MMGQKALDGFDVAVDNKAKLEAKFIIPPFSVMDTRQGYWQDRKRLWLSLGIQSELGRDTMLTLNSYEVTQENLNYYRNKKRGELTFDMSRGYTEQGKKLVSRQEADKRSNVTGAPAKPKWATGTGTTNMAPGTSIFDPVLCELIYKWFCPNSGHILDPFAGGSVRGIVACILGDNYTGVDLSPAQIKANKEQAEAITPNRQPRWIAGDSYGLDTLLPSGEYYDLVFSCPPYHDLEQYTDDPADLSNMSWDTFKERYRAIIEKCILKLNNNRFACFVVSEIRGGEGAYKGLVPYTIDCFTKGGVRYYNEMILVNVVGSLPIRIAGQFNYRKIGRTHQNILVFYKGNPDMIPRYFKDIDTSLDFAGNE